MKFLIGYIFILSICSCNSSEQQTGNGLQSDTLSLVTPKDSSFNDSIFAGIRQCCLDSDQVEFIWQSQGHKVTNDEEHPLKRLTTVLARSKDCKQILQLIDSFPTLKEKPELIMSIKCDCWEEFYLFCDKDTLLRCSWDIGKHQIHMNTEAFKIDFEKFDRILENMKDSKAR